MIRTLALLLIISTLATGCRTGAGLIAELARAPVVLNDDTSWCWFQDERLVIHNGQLLLAGVSSDGDVTVTAHEIATGETSVALLHERLQADDHNAPALLVLPDGRYLAAYSLHGDDNYTRWRISARPGDPSEWVPERLFDNGAGTTYSNLFRMADEGPNGRIYNFTRTRGWDPNFLISDDDGAGWSHGGRLLDGGGDEQRPYASYAGDGTDEIHFIATERHPRNYPNSIYHGYVSGGKSHASDGTVADEDAFDEEAPSPKAFTLIFQGDAHNVAWTSDIRLDRHDHPYIAYSVVTDRTEISLGGMDIRYRYARWDGSGWHDHEIAYAGTRLYPGEDEYSGLVTLHPSTPDAVFISTDVFPDTGVPILVDGERRREIFYGLTRDRGATWRWTQVTKNSSEDNLRPIVAADGDTWALVWLRGSYRSYTDYDQKALGLIFRGVPR
jgi:hypothetical protein